MFLLNMLAPLLSVWKSTPSPARITRRLSRRYRAGEEICCELCLPEGSFEAQVVDISPQGIGVRVRRWATPGTGGHLHLFTRTCLCGYKVRLRVARCEWAEAGYCIVGGQFEEALEPEALKLLLR